MKIKEKFEALVDSLGLEWSIDNPALEKPTVTVGHAFVVGIWHPDKPKEIILQEQGWGQDLHAAAEKVYHSLYTKLQEWAKQHNNLY